ncbi:MAG: hypothetical protein ABFC24_05370 [Methanoregulaceae archaeon]
MQLKELVVVVSVLILLMVAAGCTGSSGSSSGSPASATGTSSAPAGSDLTPTATDALPNGYSVTVDVGEKDYLGKVAVIFQGGDGQIHTKSGTATLTRADGQVVTGTFGNTKGSEAELQGTKQTDRIQVWVTMDNGKTYKIIDKQVEYRTRG